MKTNVILVLIFSLLCVNCGQESTAEKSEYDKFLSAIRQDRIEKVAEILAQNPELLHQKSSEKAETPLHFACENSKPETVEFLLKKGANINEKSKNGNTALHFAFKNRMDGFEMMRVLLENKADFKQRNMVEKDVWDEIYTSKKGKLFSDDFDFLALLLRFGYLPDTTSNDENKNILHELCARSDSPEITEFLVEKHGMNPNQKDINGWTPLHYASKGTHYEVARILLKNGVDVNAQTTRQVGSSKGRWSYPENSTPWDIYGKQSLSKSNKSTYPLFKKFGGKRSEDLTN